MPLRRAWDRSEYDASLSVDVPPTLTDILFGTVEALCGNLSALDKARRMVAVDRDVLGGTPCFKGTRIPVHDIAAIVSSGEQKAAILNAYPRLTGQQIDLAVIYAEAYPKRGRPRRHPPWRKDAPLSSETLSLDHLPRAS